MKHFATPEYWECFNAIPKSAQLVARKNFELLKKNPSHPSLRFKKIKHFRSVRAGLRFRALGVESGENIVWFWIGSHAQYDKLIS